MLRLTFALAVLLSLAFKPVAAQDILAAIANISANDYESRQDVIERNVVLQRNMQTSSLSSLRGYVE